MHKKLVIILVITAVAMFGFGFALVPIYNSLCRSFGINGKTNVVADNYNPANGSTDKSRIITVEFLTTVNRGLSWQFYPKVNKVTVHPGEMKLVQFYAENDSDHTIVVQAIPSVTPGLAAKYLRKTECFCFTQQTLKAHEAMDMPVLFHLDPEMPREINTITLSYMMYDVTG